MTAQAYVAHEIVQDLRTGVITGTRFGKVITVGHSQGSFTGWVEAATYHDVAGLIITGAAHVLAQIDVSALGNDFDAALDDPAFVDSGLDSGYLTTVPGSRAALFYNTADSDPSVVARDEATKDVVSATLVSADAPLVQSTLTRQIDVPVLVVIGSDDINCGPEVGGGTFDCSSGQEIASEEAPWYSPAAQLRTCSIPGSGHDINLALNHRLEEVDAIAWSFEYVGQDGVTAPRSAGLPPNCS